MDTKSIKTNYIPEFARYWLSALGSSTSKVLRLNSGINNYVYVCEAKKKKWIIKGYPKKPYMIRDGMQAEIEFLKFANINAKEYVASIYGYNYSWRSAVFEYIEGKGYEENTKPSKEEITSAMNFIKALNGSKTKEKLLITMDASESFLEIRSHISNIERRIESMRTDHIDKLYEGEAKKIKEKLERQVKLLKKMYMAKSGTEKIFQLRKDQRCISPSDFGFHNAILTEKGIKFIDFEHAGWDDPAKMITDFILQPHCPTGEIEIDSVMDTFNEGRETLKKRVELMMTIMTLKWSCIIMNMLTPTKYIERIKQQPLQEQNTNLFSIQMKRFHEHEKRHRRYVI